MEQALGCLFITSSSFHFFSKTDLEQYLFNVTFAAFTFTYYYEASYNASGLTGLQKFTYAILIEDFCLYLQLNVMEYDVKRWFSVCCRPFKD